MGSFTTILGLIAIVWPIILLLWKELVKALLRWKNIVVEGYVIDRLCSHSRRGTSYYLKYTYSYQGKTYSHKMKVDKASYHIWSDGGEVKVRCFPAFAYIGLPDV